jgi:hypothetical protein
LGDTKWSGGLGDDKVEIGGKGGTAQSLVHLAGNVTINNGDGKNRTVIRAKKETGAVALDGDLTVKGGDGVDRVRLQQISVTGKTKIKTGGGADKVRIRDSFFADLVKVDLGDDLDDLFEDLGGNVFDGGIHVV